MASKFFNKITNGYHSRRECVRANDLKLLERAGKITNLKEQVKFTLLEPFKDNQGNSERGIIFIVDFAYTKNNQDIVEDVKSKLDKNKAPKTKIVKGKLVKIKPFCTKNKSDYIMKRKLFKARYPQYIFYENTD